MANINTKITLSGKQMLHFESLYIKDDNRAMHYMQKAGIAVYEEVKKHKKCKVLVLCGCGNNGGDGYVVAELLRQNEWDVSVFSLEESRTDISKYYKSSYEGKYDNSEESIRKADIIIDGLYGIGAKGRLPERILHVMEQVNRANKYCISIDIPSGISADTGAMLGNAIKANETITFFCKKLGHLLMPGKVYSGVVKVKDIGFPIACCSDKYLINSPSLWKHLIPKPKFSDHKYSRGCLGIIAGDMIGASILAAQAARRSGCGIVKIFINTQTIIYPIYPGIVIISYTSKRHLIELLMEHKVKTVLFGSGVSAFEDVIDLVIELLKKYNSLIFDGGALIKKEVFSNYIENQDVLLTPHLAEFKRLFGDTGKDKVQDLTDASNFSKSTILLKGADSIISRNKNVLIQDNGCPYLATAGTGDVLSGICGAFMSQGISSYFSCAISIWLMAESAKQIGYGLISEDIPDVIPKILKEILYIDE